MAGRAKQHSPFQGLIRRARMPGAQQNPAQGMGHRLARHAGRVVTHRQLLAEVWGPQVARQEPVHYLRVYVGHLREKIEEDPSQPRRLITEPGIGYRLVDAG